MPPGTKPTPTALKKAAGNPGKRPLNEDEPQPDPLTAPEPPTHLADAGARKWRELAPQLSALRILTALDLDLLTIYCELYQDYEACKELVAAEGMVQSGQHGGMYLHPAQSQANAARTQMVKIMAEFGMTPSSRSRISVGEPKEKGKLSKYRGDKTG